MGDAQYRMSLRNKTLRPVRSRQGAKRRGATRVSTSHETIIVTKSIALRLKADALGIYAEDYGAEQGSDMMKSIHGCCPNKA